MQFQHPTCYKHCSNRESISTEKSYLKSLSIKSPNNLHFGCYFFHQHWCLSWICFTIDPLSHHLYLFKLFSFRIVRCIHYFSRFFYFVSVISLFLPNTFVTIFFYSCLCQVIFVAKSGRLRSLLHRILSFFYWILS